MDYLMGEEAGEMTPVSIRNKTLLEKLEMIDQLEAEDQQTIMNVIDSMLTKNKILEALKPKKP
jgi:hypothetical protein